MDQNTIPNQDEQLLLHDENLEYTTPMARSRLNQKANKKIKRHLIFSVIGIIIILFLLIKFGVPALINFSLFMANIKSSNPSSNTATTPGFLAPPTLNEPFTATNSASITVSGTTLPKTTVQLYVNDALTDATEAKDDGSFSFSNVTLTKDLNSIKVRAKQDNKQSDFSDNYLVTYKNKAPSLTIDSPHDNDSFPKETSTVTVKGKTDPNVRVTVNGFWAVTDDSGNYSYTLSLQGGDNHIIVVATDSAGNNTQQQIKVTYSQ